MNRYDWVESVWIICTKVADFMTCKGMQKQPGLGKIYVDNKCESDRTIFSSVLFLDMASV